MNKTNAMMPLKRLLMVLFANLTFFAFRLEVLADLIVDGPYKHESYDPPSNPDNSQKLFLIIGGVIFIILVIVLTVILLKMSRRKKKGENNSAVSRTCAPAQKEGGLSNIPAYLRYPDDPVSEAMFDKSMEEVRNITCGYRFMLYKEAADPIPYIEKNSSPHEIDETHYYFNNNGTAWYTVGVMKGESVRQNSVRNWVEKADQFLDMMGAMDSMLRLPLRLRGKKYTQLAKYDMGECLPYNQLHGFDESHVYSHIFLLDRQIYKKFILVAQKGNCAWRAEVNIGSDQNQIMPQDFVPCGQTFGSFFPL